MSKTIELPYKVTCEELQKQLEVTTNPVTKSVLISNLANRVVKLERLLLTQ